MYLSRGLSSQGYMFLSLYLDHVSHFQLVLVVFSKLLHVHYVSFFIQYIHHGCHLILGYLIYLRKCNIG
jgi:hypothetical protein